MRCIPPAPERNLPQRIVIPGQAKRLFVVLAKRSANRDRFKLRSVRFTIPCLRRTAPRCAAHGMTLKNRNTLKGLFFFGPASRFAWPGRRIAGRIASVCLALVLFSLPCEAALSPRQLSTAVLSPSPDAALPLGATFGNSTGSALTLGDAIGGKPAVLILADYTCRFICGTTLAIAAYGLSATGLQPGKDFSLVVMGIDPKDKAADAKAMKDAELAPYPALKAAAHFLSGDASAIASVTRALNYTPVYDAEIDQYAHPIGAVILTPGGRVSRLISGLNLNANSFKAALKDAGDGGLPGLVEGIRLLCYGHSPLHGAYASTVRAALAAGGLLTLAGIAGAAVLFAKRGGNPS